MHFAEELLAKFQGQPAYKLPSHKDDYQCRVIDLSKGEF
jgi:heptosyltransferase-2